MAHHQHEDGDEHHSHWSETSSHTAVFAIGVTLNIGFVLFEAGVGFATQSLALLGDAGHNLSDVLALLLAWGAAGLTQRSPTTLRTYGWRRVSILAPLLNAMILLAVTGAIGVEAVRRIGEHGSPNGAAISGVAAVGVVVNLLAALLFAGGREHDLNIRAAFFHLASDAAVSLGVVVTGVAIYLTGQQWMDSAASLLICGVVLWGSWGLLRDAFHLAVDGVPLRIDMAQVREYLLSLPSVADIHDLHVWGMSTTDAALTAHLVLSDMTDTNRLLAVASRDLHDQFRIGHVTLQIEAGDPSYPCILAGAHVV